MPAESISPRDITVSEIDIPDGEQELAALENKCW
jgi:hypothetical protein